MCVYMCLCVDKVFWKGMNQSFLPSAICKKK